MPEARQILIESICETQLQISDVAKDIFGDLDTDSAMIVKINLKIKLLENMLLNILLGKKSFDSKNSNSSVYERMTSNKSSKFSRLPSNNMPKKKIKFKEERDLETATLDELVKEFEMI